MCPYMRVLQSPSAGVPCMLLIYMVLNLSILFNTDAKELRFYRPRRYYMSSLAFRHPCDRTESYSGNV